MNLEEQRTFIKDKLNELREFVNGTNVVVEEVQFERLYDLLMDSMCDVRMKPFTTQVSRTSSVISTCVIPAPPIPNSRIGVKWDLPDGYVSVLFGPGDNWEWEARSIERDCSNLRDDEESDPSFEVRYRHVGACSFKIRDTPYYYLPDEMEELVSIPDTFVGTYEPMLKPYQYQVVWVTNKYDGMLAGYARHDTELHYFDVVEETDFKRNRMFAVYKLSKWEQFNVWRQYHWWHTALASKVYWKLYRWVQGLKRRKSPEEHWAQVDRFRQTHEVVGYFEG